jgi:spoIIIJ-associated protein
MDEKENLQNGIAGADGRSLDRLGAEPGPESVPDTDGPAKTVSEPARRTGTDSPTLTEAELVHRVLTDILHRIGFRARVEFEKRADGYYANIRSRQSTGLLIGHRGNTLRSLQYLVRLIVRQTYPDVPMVTVDVSGYRVRRENFLRRKATAIARIVMETRREMALDLLTEKEMELVRDALRVEPGIRVHALGTGTRRNVIIAPVQEQRAP